MFFTWFGCAPIVFYLSAPSYLLLGLSSKPALHVRYVEALPFAIHSLGHPQVHNTSIVTSTHKRGPRVRIQVASLRKSGKENKPTNSHGKKSSRLFTYQASSVGQTGFSAPEAPIGSPTQNLSTAHDVIRCKSRYLPSKQPARSMEAGFWGSPW